MTGKNQNTSNSTRSSKVNISIDGMTCATCAITVEKELKRLDGVIDAVVSLATESAAIEYDADLVELDDFRRAVASAGYQVVEPSTDKAILDIEGMTCASCAQTIERALRSVAGVDDVTVNLATDQATVTFDRQVVTLDSLRQSVLDAGYRVARKEVVRERERLQRDIRKVAKARAKMWLAWAFAIPIVVWMIPEMAFGIMWPNALSFHIGMIVLAAPVLLFAGRETLRAGAKSAFHLSPNMDTLIMMGTTVAYATGFVAVIAEVGAAPTLLNYSGVAAMIMAFHLTGRYIETKAKGRASQAIQKLLSLEAKTAKVLRNGQEIEIPVDEVVVGDLMIVRPGEKIPTDGVVLEGESAVDESLATGESMPVAKQKGAKVIGATINKHGLLKVEATGVGEETFLAQVIRLVEQAQGSKVPIQEFADRVTRVFVPTILGIALLTLVAWLALPGTFYSVVQWADGFVPWVNSALDPVSLALFAAIAVLVIACPCALGLATPTALMVGSGMGAENGVLIRNGEAIQTMKSVNTIVLDKTGTITQGKPGVTDVVPTSGQQEEVILQVAASVESGSEHPLGEAIVKGAQDRGLSILDMSEFNAIPGKGVEARVDGRSVLVGNINLMEERGVTVSGVQERLAELENQAKTAMLVAIDGELVGTIAVADQLKIDSERAIAELKELGLEPVMITGDNERTAKAIAREVGIERILASVLPEQKAAEIRRLQDEGLMVAMVGDGINDAPALKQANVGIAVGTGTDIAIESSDITLVQGDLSAVVKAVKLSRATFRKIKQNLFWAYFYNAVAIPIAMLGLLHPVVAEAAMAFSSINVVANANRLRRVSIRPRVQ